MSTDVTGDETRRKRVEAQILAMSPDQHITESTYWQSIAIAADAAGDRLTQHRAEHRAQWHATMATATGLRLLHNGGQS